MQRAKSAPTRSQLLSLLPGPMGHLSALRRRDRTVPVREQPGCAEGRSGMESGCRNRVEELPGAGREVTLENVDSTLGATGVSKKESDNRLLLP